MKKMKILAIPVLLMFSLFAYADDVESFGSCKFRFEGENMARSFEYTMILMRISGASEPKEQIYKNICNHFPNNVITVKPAKAGPNPIGEVNGLKHIKISTSSCSFDYYYGINGDSFVSDSNYKNKCAKTTANKSRVTLFKQQNIKASKGGTQYYSIGCSDGSSGTVSETDAGNSYGSICASSSVHGSDCRPKDTWSLELAAQRTCGN